MRILAVVGGGSMQMLGKYKSLHIMSFAFIISGFGLFTLLDIFLSTALPTVQAKLSDGDRAKATGVWQLMRSFGLVFGSAIPRPSSTPELMNLRVRLVIPR
jgi:hypothetical protein